MSFESMLQATHNVMFRSGMKISVLVCRLWDDIWAYTANKVRSLPFDMIVLSRPQTLRNHIFLRSTLLDPQNMYFCSQLSRAEGCILRLLRYSGNYVKW